MAELKPCPFCGGKPYHYFFNDGFFNYARVECKKCGVMLTQVRRIGTEAIEAWNRRYAEPKEIEFDYEAED